MQIFLWSISLEISYKVNKVGYCTFFPRYFLSFIVKTMKKYGNQIWLRHASDNDNDNYDNNANNKNNNNKKNNNNNNNNNNNV